MTKVSIKDSSCKYKVMSGFLNLIEKDHTNPVILCIGTDKVTGDALGPLVGELLVHEHNVKTFVYGTLSRPINAINLVAAHNFIKRNHPNSKIVAIDASLGKPEDQGIINIFKGGLKPGAALSKPLPQIGDYSITANVNEWGRENIVMLAKSKFGTVHELAQNIAFGISDALSLKKGLSSLYA